MVFDNTGWGPLTWAQEPLSQLTELINKGVSQDMLRALDLGTGPDPLYLTE